MEDSNIQFLGTPCGHHGPYTFYKGFKYNKKGKTRVLTLGEFFFVKILKDTAICLAELHLLWQDRNHEDLQLASVKFYFLPENTPEGRLPCHGEDELLAESEKVVLSVEDLLTWIIEDEVSWPFGCPAIHDSGVATSKVDLYCPPDVTAEADQLIEAFSANNSGVNFIQDVEKIKNSAQEHIPDKCQHPKKTEVLVLSFAQYCRYRAVLCRLSNCTNLWLKSALISAIGGFTVKSHDTRIHFCRDSFDHPDLEDHEFRQDHLAPNLKGRPRRKRRKRDWGLESDSNDSSEHAAYIPKPEKRLPLGLQKKSTQLPGHNYLSSPARGKMKVEKANGRQEHKPKEHEQVFLKKLHEFMRLKKSPIGRIPTLGFKEIDLYEFYSYAKKLGGYEQITGKRLWKHIYDKLGGNPTNTSAATCTRRHYERLLLPYELHLRGLEQKAGPGSSQVRKFGKGTSNTVRNHLKDKHNIAASQPKAMVPTIPQEQEHIHKAAKSASDQIANGRELSAVKQTTDASIGLVHKQEDVNSRISAGFMPVPPALSVPPGLLLPPGMTLPPGLLLGLQQLPNSKEAASGCKYTHPSTNISTLSSTLPHKAESSFNNKTQKVDGKAMPNLPPNVQVLPNGTIVSSVPPKRSASVSVPAPSHVPHSGLSTTDSVSKEEPRPSVIHHTAQKSILNPAPTPRPNIPKTVYGPPNAMPTTVEISNNHKRPYSQGSSLSDSYGLPKPPLIFQSPSLGLEVPNKRNRVDPNSWSSVSSFMPASTRPLSHSSSHDDADDQPKDLSMKHSRSTVVNDVNPPAKTQANEFEAPLNLSLKAHQMPKTASVCVPKLPVNPFKPVNMSAPKHGAQSFESYGQNVTKANHRTANIADQRPDYRAASKPEQRVEQRTATNEQRVEQRTATHEQRVEQRTVTHEQRVEQRTATHEQRLEQRTATHEQRVEQRTATHEQRVTPRTATQPEQRVEQRAASHLEQRVEQRTVGQLEQRGENAAVRTAPPLLLPDTPESILASLGALPLVHPAFPAFPMGSMLPPTSTLPVQYSSVSIAPTFTMATNTVTPPLPPSILAQGMYFPGLPTLPAYALSAVANQVYPHLYLPTSSQSQPSPSSNSNKK